MIDVLIPLKSLSRAKTRLRSVLPAGHRMALVNAMARDVIERLVCQDEVSRVFAIVGHGWDRSALIALGAEVIPESGLSCDVGLNGVLTSAVQRCSADRIAIVHGDLPFITGSEMGVLDRALEDCERVFCPDENHTGTNALAFRADAAPQLVFGGGSFDRFCHMAEEGCGRWSVQVPEGLSRDIDDPADLSRLLEGVGTGQLPGGHTKRWARQLAWTPVPTPGVSGLHRDNSPVWDREATL